MNPNQWASYESWHEEQHRKDTIGLWNEMADYINDIINIECICCCQEKKALAEAFAHYYDAKVTHKSAEFHLEEYNGGHAPGDVSQVLMTLVERRLALDALNEKTVELNKKKENLSKCLQKFCGGENINCP